MTEINKANNDFNSTNFFIFLWNWRKVLFIIILASAILSAAASFLITPKYKSKVILFPTLNNSISKALLNENNGNNDILDFGEEEQAEQLLQILESSKIREKIIQRFDLVKHFDIDEKSELKNVYLNQEYENNISCKRTEFMAVEISVLDKDPQMAADIANAIADLLDSTKNEMQKIRAKRGFEIVKANYESIRNEINLLNDSLDYIRSKGINDYESQSERINQELAIQIGKDNKPAIKRLEAKLDTLSKYGGMYVLIRNTIGYKTDKLNRIKAKYDEAKIDAEEYMPQKFVIDPAYKSLKKSSPVRWLIVTISVFSSFMLSILVLIFIENVYKKNILKS